MRNKKVEFTTYIYKGIPLIPGAIPRALSEQEQIELMENQRCFAINTNNMRIIPIVKKKQSTFKEIITRLVLCYKVLRLGRSYFD